MPPSKRPARRLPPEPIDESMKSKTDEAEERRGRGCPLHQGPDSQGHDLTTR